jgi:hypothetical protein
MEGLAPPLKCAIELQAAIRNGESVRTGVHRFVGTARADDEFATYLRGLLVAWERGLEWRSSLDTQSPQRRALVEIVANGIAGHAIASQLDAVRLEVERACEHEIREHLELLPLKMLVPLLLFQFPAFLLLMFGPLLRHLVEEMNR